MFLESGFGRFILVAGYLFEQQFFSLKPHFFFAFLKRFSYNKLDFKIQDSYNQKPSLYLKKQTEALSGPTCLVFWPTLVRGPKQKTTGKILGELSREGSL